MTALEKTVRLGYNKKMTIDKFEFPSDHPGHGRPHDYFGRKTIGDPLIAADLLRHYTKPVVAEHVDLDNLRAEPTHFLGPTQFLTGPKEVILDVPYVARLRDDTWKSEVLMIIRTQVFARPVRSASARYPSNVIPVQTLDGCRSSHQSPKVQFADTVDGLGLLRCRGLGRGRVFSKDF